MRLSLRNEWNSINKHEVLGAHSSNDWLEILNGLNSFLHGLVSEYLQKSSVLLKKEFENQSRLCDEFFNPMLKILHLQKKT